LFKKNIENALKLEEVLNMTNIKQAYDLSDDKGTQPTDL
jgi:hypothetical protein